MAERFQYGPYGELVAGNASVTPFLFNGMYGVMTDGNGLYHMRARFYSAEIKRFLNRDVLVGSVARGQSLNRFAFVTGRPVSFVDPFGLEGQCASWECAFYGAPLIPREEFYEHPIDCPAPNMTDHLIYSSETNCYCTLECEKTIIGSGKSLAVGAVCGKATVPILGGLVCNSTIVMVCGSICADECNIKSER